MNKASAVGATHASPAIRASTQQDSRCAGCFGRGSGMPDPYCDHWRTPKAIAVAIALLLGTSGLADEALEKPNFSGVWQVLNTANYNIEAHMAQASMQLIDGPFGPLPARELVPLGAVGAVPSGLGVVEGGPLPYQDWALARRDEHRANWLDRDPEIKCFLPGVPRATYMPLPFQIFHGDSAILIAYEYAGATRNIPFEDPGEPPADSWMGQSWARWEDDVLVITTTGQNDQTWFDRSGNFHSEQMTVVERIRRIGPHHLDYQAEIRDEAVFTRAWTMRMTLYERIGADAQLGQFKCVEFVEELLYGHLRKAPVSDTSVQQQP